MIIEIALGIVLGFILLVSLPVLIPIAGVALIVIVGIGLLIVAALYVWEYPEIIAVVAAFLALGLILKGVLYLWLRVPQKVRGVISLYVRLSTIGASAIVMTGGWFYMLYSIYSGHPSWKGEDLLLSVVFVTLFFGGPAVVLWLWFRKVWKSRIVPKSEAEERISKSKPENLQKE